MSWRHVEASWRRLGASWERLGEVLERLGCVLAVVGVSWNLLKRFECVKWAGGGDATHFQARAMAGERMADPLKPYFQRIRNTQHKPNTQGQVLIGRYKGKG